MKLPRSTSDDERNELKAATRQALAIARPTRFAAVTRVDAPALSKYGDPFTANAFMPIDIVADLERDLGAPLITEALAALQGYRLVPVGDGDAGGRIGVDDLASLSKEGGDVVQTIATAMADGRIDGHERRAIAAEIAENVTVLRRIGRKVTAG